MYEDHQYKDTMLKYVPIESLLSRKAREMKKKITLVLLISTVMILSGCGNDTMRTRTVRFSNNQTDIVKAMTFNVRTKTFIDGFNGWNHRKQSVFNILSDNSPDIIKR